MPHLAERGPALNQAVHLELAAALARLLGADGRDVMVISDDPPRHRERPRERSPFARRYCAAFGDAAIARGEI